MAEEQSHREEMNAAIRAQRERLKGSQQPKPDAPKRPSLLSRLRGK